MRAVHKEDFTVDVEHIGQFTFGRRTKKDQFQIRGLYGKLTSQNWKDDGTAADMEAWMYATLDILTVQNPSAFSLEGLDPLKDDDDDDRLSRVYVALRHKELSFRPKPSTGGTGAGEGPGS